MSQLALFAPIAMLELSSSIDIKFAEFDDLKDHPLASAFMPTFKELLEGMMGFDMEKDIEPFDLEKVPESKREGFLYEMLKKMSSMVEIALKLLKCVSDEGLISWKAAIKKNLAVEGKFVSRGLAKLCTIGLMCAVKA